MCELRYKIVLESSKTGDLKIIRLSQYAGLCRGNDELWLLVEKVQRSKYLYRSQYSGCPKIYTGFQLCSHAK